MRQGKNLFVPLITRDEKLEELPVALLSSQEALFHRRVHARPIEAVKISHQGRLRATGRRRILVRKDCKLRFERCGPGAKLLELCRLRWLFRPRRDLLLRR